MSKVLLETKKLEARTCEREILRGVDLKIKLGEIHVVMGVNGAGKSTLARALMGDPELELSGEIYFEGNDIIDESADKRARRGIFMSFQAPEEVPGISVASFMRSAKKAYSGDSLQLLAFQQDFDKAAKNLGFNPELANRQMNVGFSGGEKKKNELLQLLVLQPKLAILDEIDSGVDVNALNKIAKALLDYKSSKNSIVLITHNSRLANKLPVDFVHIMRAGKIVRSGSKSLMMEIEERGFDESGKKHADGKR